MLRIAICDDMPDELRKLVGFINEYLKEKGIHAELKSYTHSDELLTAIGLERFHVYILDIVMPMVNGLELGKSIRRLDREAQIIYATTEPQYALQAYAASPLNYLIKPIDKGKLFETLNLAIGKVDATEEQTFSVKTADGLRIIKLSDVDCCEYRNHGVSFTLINGEVLMSRTIRESFAAYVAPLLKDRHFIQCHTSFIINMKRVELFTKDSFTLRGGRLVPISAKQYSLVRDTYMDYLMAKEIPK